MLGLNLAIYRDSFEKKHIGSDIYLKLAHGTLIAQSRPIKHTIE